MSPFPPSRLRHAALVAVAVALVSLPARSAPGDECRSPLPDAEPRLDFKLETGPISWHGDKTRDQIRTLRANSGAKVAAVGPHWQSIGLTLSKFILAVEVSVTATPLRAAAPAHCARLTAAKVRFGTQRMDVYVAREYKPGTCPHEIVREHEARHVAIYQDAIRHYAPLIERRLETAARAMRPVRVATAQDGAERLRKALHDELSLLFDAMGRDVERDNGVLDTPAAYAAERQRCPLW